MEGFEVVQAIESGELDEATVDIGRAIQKRVFSNEVRWAWKIEFENLSFTEQDMTGAEGKLIERQINRNVWITPPNKSIEWLCAYVVALLVSRGGMDWTAAIAKVDGMPADVLKDAVSEYVVADPPKDSGVPTPP